jgi:Tfp pilus assembly protein PilF
MFPPFFGCGLKEQSPSAVLSDAGRQLDQGNTQQAIDILEAYEERKPGNPQVLEQLAFAWAQKGEAKMAAYYFNRLAQVSPERQDALLFAAQSLEQGGDRPGAIALYEQYLAKNHEDAGACIAYARLAAAQGLADRALSSYHLAYELKPSGATASALARLYLDKNNEAQASVWYDTALKDHPDQTETALMGLLEIAIRQKDYPKADAYVTRLQKDFPGSLETSAMKDVPAQLAEWKQKQEDLRKATAALTAARLKPPQPPPPPPPPVAEQPAPKPEAAPESIPIDPDAPARPADRLTKAEAVAKAASAEEQADLNASVKAAAAPAPHIVEPPPSAPPGPLELARKARDGGNLQEAARLYPHALAMEPTAAVWNEYSIVSLNLGNTGQAFAASLEATRMDPYNAGFALQYLRVAQAVYEPRRFLGELIQMRRRFPDAPVITLALARAYAQVDHNARNARILYDEFLLKYPNHPLYAQASKERDELPAP